MWNIFSSTPRELHNLDIYPESIRYIVHHQQILNPNGEKSIYFTTQDVKDFINAPRHHEAVYLCLKRNDSKTDPEAFIDLPGKLLQAFADDYVTKTPNSSRTKEVLHKFIDELQMNPQEPFVTTNKIKQIMRDGPKTFMNGLKVLGQRFITEFEPGSYTPIFCAYASSMGLKDFCHTVWDSGLGNTIGELFVINNKRVHSNNPIIGFVANLDLDNIYVRELTLPEAESIGNKAVLIDDTVRTGGTFQDLAVILGCDECAITEDRWLYAHDARRETQF